MALAQKSEQKPDAVMHVYRNGEEIAESPLTLNDSNDWMETLSGLARYDEEGKEYEYTVEEEAMAGYYNEITSSKDIINENTGSIYFHVINYPYLEVTATKVWDGGPNVKPDVTLQLYKQEDTKLKPEPVGEPVTLKNGETTYTWTNLPNKEKETDFLEYTVKEVNVPADYEVSYSEDTFTITNTFTGVIPVDPEPETFDIEGTKTWKDNNDKAKKVQIL